MFIGRVLDRKKRITCVHRAPPVSITAWGFADHQQSGDSLYAAKEKFNRIIELKAQVNFVKKYIRPLIYLDDAFHMNENKFIHRGNEKYFSGIGTRFKKLYDFVASLGDLVSQIQNSYDSAVSMRESETSEKLTLLAGMVAPLTVITGIYGMNFTFMPELSDVYLVKIS